MPKKPHHRRALRAQLLFRRSVVAVIILIQAAYLMYFIQSGSMPARHLSSFFRVMSFFVMLYVINKQMKPGYRLIWVTIILLFPVVGCLFYLLIHLIPAGSKVIKRSRQLAYELPAVMDRGNHVIKEDFGRIGRWRRMAEYLTEHNAFPLYDHTKTEYISPGEAFLPRLLADLESARSYIYMEYFILERGKMLNPVLSVLKRKVREGVDVRILYDDIGSMLVLPQNFSQDMANSGIKAIAFNRFIPLLTSVQNNRDHRKITSIDGRIGYTGGINLADEYINAYPKHGYWMDNALRLEGQAVWSLSCMFMEMWSLASQKPFFMPHAPYQWDGKPPEDDGLVLPYADSPLDQETVGENVYMTMIQNAEKYLYITTPYFVVDDGILSALLLAAKSGVDVRIITPKVWDKRLVHIVTRSYYRILLEGGIKIYEYSPGFMHQKMMIADDLVATVGTVNLAYRSLYLHFENGVFLYGSGAVAEAKNDYMRNLRDSEEITLRSVKGTAWTRLLQSVLRLFAPLI